MLLGDLMTAVQEDLRIKIAVYDNGKFGFIDVEQKSVGLIPTFTDLKNPNFGELAKAMGIWGHQVSRVGDLEESVRTWLAQPGPGVLDVKVKPMQLVTPPSPFVSPEAVARLHRQGRCCTAKDTTSGKWWSRTSRDRMKPSLSLRAGALIVRDAARTGSRLNPFPRNWGQRISKQWNDNMPTSTAPAPLAPASLQSSPRARQPPLPGGERGRLRMSGFATRLVWVFPHLMSMPQLQTGLRVQRLISPRNAAPD
jgi:hypothetical protein